MQVACHDDEAAALAAMTAVAGAGAAFDVVIVDRPMASEETETVYQRIRTATAHAGTPLIVLTAESAKIAGDQTSQASLHILPKPLRRSMLLQTLRATFAPQDAADEPVGAAAKRDPHGLDGAYPLHALLVEDNAINREVASEMLMQLGCRVTTAINGREGLEMSGRQSFDVIFMDCQMPVMDGFEAAAAIRQREGQAAAGSPAARRTPIVALTANVLQSDRTACFKAGMDQFLTKPVSRLKIAEVLNLYLPRGAAPQAMPNPAPEPEETAPAAGGDALDPAIADPLRQGRPDLWRRLIQLFSVEQDKANRTIAEGIAGNNTSLVKAAAHSMKSASANVGATRLSEIYRALEQAAMAGQIETCRDLAARAVEEAERVGRAMAQPAQDPIGHVA